MSPARRNPGRHPPRTADRSASSASSRLTLTRVTAVAPRARCGRPVAKMRQRPEGRNAPQRAEIANSSVLKAMGDPVAGRSASPIFRVAHG